MNLGNDRNNVNRTETDYVRIWHIFMTIKKSINDQEAQCIYYKMTIVIGNELIAFHWLHWKWYIWSSCSFTCSQSFTREHKAIVDLYFQKVPVGMDDVWCVLVVC